MDAFLLNLHVAFSSALGQWVLRLPVELNLGVAGLTIRDLSFRIDSGSDITQIPAAFLPDGIRFRRPLRSRRRFRTAAGEGTGHEISFAFSFAKLPGWSFPCLGLVNERRDEGSLAWRDIARRFEVKTVQRTLIPDLRERLTVGMAGALLLSLYPEPTQDGIRAF